MKRAQVLLTGIALLLGCGEPSVGDTFGTAGGLLRGTLLYPEGAARGNVQIFLFNAAAPPPPEGQGSPVTFIVVPQRALFGDSPAGEVRTFSTSFVVPAVPAGEYTIRAFLDADGDFNPLFSLLNEPTAGDVAGGFADVAGNFKTVRIESNGIVDHDVLVTLLPVVPVERPAFRYTASSSTSFTLPLQLPQAVSIEVNPIERAQVKMDPERTRFLLQYVDANRDGQPEDGNGDGLPDVYPQVLLRQPGMAPGTSIVIPAIINPLPYVDRLNRDGAVLVSQLDLVIPPVALSFDGAGAATRVPIPPGLYQTIVVSATGQTWTIPNDLDTIQPTASDPSQAVYIEMVGVATDTNGLVAGEIETLSAPEGPAYAFLFRAEAPPPPLGLGQPIAGVRVEAETFAARGDRRFARFEIPDVAPGEYFLWSFLDRDRDFVPYVDLLAEPSAGDWTARTPEQVAISAGALVAEAKLVLDRPLLTERPAFEFAAEDLVPARSSFTRLRAHPIAALGHDPVRTRFRVRPAESSLAPGFALAPIALEPALYLERIAEPTDGAELRGLRVLVPAFVDPLPFLTLLPNGPVQTEDLPIVVPPVAIALSGTGAKPLDRVPPGKYRLTVVEPEGQTWTVPNAVNALFGRSGSPAEDPTQDAVLSLGAPAPGPGRLDGRVRRSADARLQTAVVLAYAEEAPPPFGAPLGAAVLGPNEETFAIAGLPSGRYTVRAFLDDDQNFSPWYPSRNEPTRGDRAGGAIDLEGNFRVFLVDAGGADMLAEVLFPSGVRVESDRPVFRLTRSATLAPGSGAELTLEGVDAHHDWFSSDGTFTVVADSDGVQFPRVFAELLDPSDPEGLRAAKAPVVLIGAVRRPEALGDGPGTAATTALQVRFGSEGLDASGQTVPAPAGSYRIRVVNAAGQSWSTPNELVRVRDEARLSGQDGRLMVGN